MGFLSIHKQDELTYKDLNKIFKILTQYKIVKIIDQPKENVISYDEKQYRGNSNTTIIPNRLYCVDHERLIYTDFIDIPLEYFPHIKDILNTHFPFIDQFVKDSMIRKVTIKPAINIVRNKIRNVSGYAKTLKDMTDQLLKPEYAPYLDSLIVAELIRRFYMGEQDKVEGFLIFKPSLKYLKAIFEEPLSCNDIINKILESTRIIDISNRFSGTDSRFTFKIFKNIILVTTKKEPYMKSLDLKYMSIFEQIGKLLDEKRFGRR